MEIIECPHCFSRVLLTSDNKCPSCRKDPNDSKNANPNLTTATFFSYETLPENCIKCGQSTKRSVKFLVEKKDENWEWEILNAIPLIGDILSPINNIVKFFKKMEYKQNSITFKLPICDKCSNSEVKPMHLNMDTDAITFIVHKAFKGELEKING